MRISDWSSDVCSSDLRVCLMERLEEQQGVREQLDRLQAPMKRIQAGLREIRHKQQERKDASPAAADAASMLAMVQQQLALLKPRATDPELPPFSEEFPTYVKRQRKQLSTALHPAVFPYAINTPPAASQAILKP